MKDSEYKSALFSDEIISNCTFETKPGKYSRLPNGQIEVLEIDGQPLKEGSNA